MRILTVDQVWTFLREQGYSEDIIDVRDAKYVTWPREFVFGEFARAFEQFKRDIGIDVYVAQEHDCEDFSDWAVCFAKLTHRRSPGRPLNTTPTFGTFDYASGQVGRRQRHCIDCIITESPSTGLELVHFEPQHSYEPKLTADERKTVYEIRF